MILEYIKELCKQTFSLVGTGGTVISVAAMIHGVQETEFDEKLNGLIIKRKDIELLFIKIKRIPEKERLNLKGLEPGREDIVVAGTIIVTKIMDYFEKDEIIICYSDLLEGILLQYMGGRKNG
jgi:exopolyphosphatase/guanosine-5'-triphosphate,3'-diphosphate pyrophosphatase